MIIAIPDDYHGLVPQLDCYRKLEPHEVRTLRDAAPPFERLLEALRDADAIIPIRERTVFDRALLEALPRLKLISQTGRSCHHIDLKTCTERGIAVVAGTHASPHTVAEHTWALILAALRRIPEETTLMRQGRWRGRFSLGLHGRTFGVYGLGTIGSLVAATARSFGMRVLVLGQEKSQARARAAGYEVARDRAQLFEASDVLSLHVRLSAATRGIVTGDDLARMKPTALLVNTARAELVAPGALAAALRSGRPGYAAVDVYEEEPVMNGDHPLLALDNALCTPHSAWLERSTYELYFGEAIDNLLAWAQRRPVKLLNPEVAQN
ncbi:MAG TPA: D-2-hydroxyacid dehydrogenase family protein [Burkholderiales bacterium]